MALILLNEALERLSQGHFRIDEYGNTTIPESWSDEYGPKYDPEASKLATKYRELWDRTPLELVIDESDRSRAYFSELAAGALIGYREDLSDEAFADLEQDFVHSEVHTLETKLMFTVVEFYECYHTWRILAEDYIGITLDELLNISQSEEQPSDNLTGPVSLDVERCETMLSIMELYIDAYDDVLTYLSEHVREELPEGVADLDDRAEENAEQMAAEISCPL